MKRIITIMALLTVLFTAHTWAQDAPSKKVSDMTKEEISQLRYEDLLNLSLEDLILVANKFGMSADDILEYFLNKDIVAASKKSEKSMESPLSTTVISKEEIERSGAINIPEALRLAPGVIVREKTPGNYDVHIHGLDNVPSNNILLYSENMMTLLMIDNRPVYNYSFGGTFWETLPVEVSDVERIEIIRGPSSALYGPNAVTGAINIITKKATDKALHLFADGAYGTNNSRITNVASTFGIGQKLKARISGNYQWTGRFNEDFYYYGDGQYHEQAYFETTDDPTMLKFGIHQPLEEDASKKEPDTKRSSEKMGVNAAFSLPVSDKLGFDLAMGAQTSNVMTTVLGNHWNPLSSRQSNTSYFDLKGRAYGFEAQFNMMGGDQDYERYVKGFHIDVQTMNSNLEYQYNYKNLSLRPGMSYQQAIYDDSKYLDVSIKEGYLNGRKELTTLAYFLRADYKAFDKLRLIAAVRNDHYNKPNDTYFTYQFVGSYKISDKHLVRAVVSKANRGPFMADTYSDYKWETVPGFYDMYWLGNENLKLPVMSMIEVGYRIKPIKNIQADIELFQTTTKNYSWFLPDSMAFTMQPIATAPYFKPTHVTTWVNYQNFDLRVKQTGASANIQIAVNKNLSMNFFGTLQETKLYNFYPTTTFQIIAELQASASTNYPSFKAKNSYDKNDEVDMTHKATPSFYGGGSINYICKEKWNFNASLYYFNKQTFTMNRSYGGTHGVDQIDAKALLNLKASYRFYKNNKVFMNVRNLLGNDSNEFAFADRIGAKYYGGLQLEF